MIELRMVPVYYKTPGCLIGIDYNEASNEWEQVPVKVQYRHKIYQTGAMEVVATTTTWSEWKDMEYGGNNVL